MMHKLRWLSLAFFVSAITNPPDANAQQRASDSEQRLLELATAKYLSAGDLRLAMMNERAVLALDPRLYNISVGREWWARNAAIEPELSPSHDAGHMMELSKLLGIPLIDDADGSCTGTPPRPCRTGANDALITFGPAFVKGDSAQLAVGRWSRSGTVDARTQSEHRMGLFGWNVRLKRNGDSWEVVKVTTGIS